MPLSWIVSSKPCIGPSPPDLDKTSTHAQICVFWLHFFPPVQGDHALGERGFAWILETLISVKVRLLPQNLSANISSFVVEVFSREGMQMII